MAFGSDSVPTRRGMPTLPLALSKARGLPAPSVGGEIFPNKNHKRQNQAELGGECTGETQ